MRKVFWVAIVISSILTLNPGCKKGTTFMGTATIIGWDPRTGICDGGIYIKIDGYPNQNDPQGYYDIGSLPPSFRIDNTTQFPIRVALDWSIPHISCGSFVNISRIEQIY